MTTREIDEWDPAKAVKMAAEIVERYGATPYGFRFRTLLTSDPVPDGKGGTLEVKPKTDRESGWHFIDGVVRTYDHIVAEEEDGERSIAASNMKGNGIPLVAVTIHRFRSTMPFGENDCTVDANGVVTARGTDPEHAEYRRRKLEEWNVVNPVMDD
jgi:hypothetical protein